MYSMIFIETGEVELNNVNFSHIIPRANVFPTGNAYSTTTFANPALIKLNDCQDWQWISFHASLTYKQGIISHFNDGYVYTNENLKQAGLLHGEGFTLARLENITV